MRLSVVPQTLYERVPLACGYLSWRRGGYALKVTKCSECRQVSSIVNSARVRQTTGTELMKRLSAIVLLILLGSLPSLSALDKNKAALVGGTVFQFNSSSAPVEGRISTSAGNQLLFTADKKPFAGQRLHIEYNQIQDLEFGQKTGRRAGLAVGASVLFGPVGLVSLASKKRSHYLTVGYTDERGKDQVVILELGKEIVRDTLAVIEARSGKQVEYQDDEARKRAR